MAKRVFFSFHYEDVRSFRANVVRNHGVTKGYDEAGFFDASIWEDAKTHGSAALKRLINSGLENTSVTCVLIGTETWNRPWVKYEILKSYDRGNALLGVHINSITDRFGRKFTNGFNPFDYLGFLMSADGTRLTYYEHDGLKWKPYSELPSKVVNWGGYQHANKWYRLSNWVPSYDWVNGNGFNNFPTWVEKAVT